MRHASYFGRLTKCQFQMIRVKFSIQRPPRFYLIYCLRNVLTRARSNVAYIGDSTNEVSGLKNFCIQALGCELKCQNVDVYSTFRDGHLYLLHHFFFLVIHYLIHTVLVLYEN